MAKPSILTPMPSIWQKVLRAASRSTMLAGFYASVVVASFADNSLVIKDPVTPTNNYNGPLMINGVIQKFTYSRASTATFVGSNGLIQTAAINVPRIEYDPVTLAVKGYVHEGARINLCLQSEAVDNGAWVNLGTSVTANTSVAPDGNSTADTITCSAGAGYHYNYQSIAALASTIYTFSRFVKAGTTRYINFGDGGDAVWHTAVLDTQTGLISATTNCTATAKALGNGFFRVSCTYTRTNGGSHNIYCAPDINSNSASAPSFTAAGTETCIVWGVQLEQAGAASSYIPTTTVAVTRAADALSLAGTAFNLTSAAGTLYIKNSWQGGTAVNPGARAALGLDDGGATNRTYLNNLAGASGYTNSSVPNSGSDLAVADGVFVKSALAFAASDWSFVQNGRTPITAAAGTPPIVTALRVGDITSAGTAPGFITVQELMFVGPRITNAAEQALTT